jgi:hypothetical protein
MEDIVPVIPDYKLYKDKVIAPATFFGGPLVAGYLMAENFKKLGETDMVRKTWIFTIVAFVAIFGTALYIPENVHFPNYLIPIGYTFLAKTLVNQYQRPQIEAHIEKGGELYSGWRIFWIILISLAATFGVLFGAVMLTENLG